MTFSLSKTKEKDAINELKLMEKEELIKLLLMIEYCKDYSRGQKDYHIKMIREVFKDKYNSELGEIIKDY